MRFLSEGDTVTMRNEPNRSAGPVVPPLSPAHSLYLPAYLPLPQPITACRYQLPSTVSARS